MRKKTLEHQWLETMEARCGWDGRGAGELRRLQHGFAGELELDRFVGECDGNGRRVYRTFGVGAAVSHKSTRCLSHLAEYMYIVQKNYAGAYVYWEGK